MAYEIFTRQMPRLSAPAMTILRTGRINFNLGAQKLARDQKWDYVLLLWDKQARKMALQGTGAKDLRAYKLQTYSKNRLCGFSAIAFLKYIGYDFSKSRCYPIEWNEKEKLMEITLRGQEG